MLLLRHEALVLIRLSQHHLAWEPRQSQGPGCEQQLVTEADVRSTTKRRRTGRQRRQHHRPRVSALTAGWEPAARATCKLLGLVRKSSTPTQHSERNGSGHFYSRCKDIITKMQSECCTHRRDFFLRPLRAKLAINHFFKISRMSVKN